MSQHRAKGHNNKHRRKGNAHSNNRSNSRNNNRSSNKSNSRGNNRNKLGAELKDRDIMQPWKSKQFRWSGHKVEVVSESRPEVAVTCQLCEQVIENPSQAFTQEDGVVHFDCILDRVNFGVELTENQKICYVGRGEFGLCEFKNSRHTGSFTILQRFTLESLEDRKELVDTLEGGGTDWGIDLDTLEGEALQELQYEG